MILPGAPSSQTMYTDAQSGESRAYNVLAGQDMVLRIFAPGAPLVFRIALTGGDIVPEHGAILWLQEPFWQEHDPILNVYRSPVIYAAHPRRHYDWSNQRGGVQRDVGFDVSARRQWYLRDATELRREQARVIWTVLHRMQEDYPGYPPDLVICGSPRMLRPARPQTHYPVMVEVAHTLLL
jgi:hypothetical protein